MDKLVAAVAAMGGLTAIGGLIDLAMWKAEKEKLKSWLEDWWLRFSDVKWSNFGRKEAELAVQLLDEWAGAKLWSWKRWRFSALVIILLLVCVTYWTALRAAVSGGAPLAAIISQLSDYLISKKTMLFSLPNLTLGLAFSFSVTRFIAVNAARLSGKSVVLNTAIFTALIMLHLLLFVYWSGTTLAVAKISYEVIAYVIESDESILRKVGNLEFTVASFGNFMDTMEYHFCLRWNAFISWSPSNLSIADVYALSIMAAYEIVANGLRILFALVFVSSFVFRPLIQTPVSRLWYNVMDSGKPFFTMLFGAIGALIAVAQALCK